MDITLDQARCLCALVDHGTYLQAAKALNKSHSAIVYALNNFEKQCGLALLNRSQYRTQLTVAGKKIHQQCQLLLEAELQLKQSCLDLKDHWESSVQLVYDGVLSPQPFLEIFQHFKSQKIPTTLGIFSDFLQGVERSFDELKADFMISILHPRRPQLITYPLKPLTSFLVAHESHEIHQTKKIWKLSELKNFNFFTVRGADQSLELGTRELEQRSIFHLSDFMMKKNLILQGAGFGWLPEELIANELKRKILRPVTWELPHRQQLRPILCHRRRKTLGKAGQWIRDHLIR